MADSHGCCEGSQMRFVGKDVGANGHGGRSNHQIPARLPYNYRIVRREVLLLKPTAKRKQVPETRHKKERIVRITDAFSMAVTTSIVESSICMLW